MITRPGLLCLGNAKSFWPEELKQIAVNWITRGIAYMCSAVCLDTHPIIQRPNSRLGAVGNIDFLEQSLDMHFYGSLRNAQRGRDHLVGLSRDQILQNL